MSEVQNHVFGLHRIRIIFKEKGSEILFFTGFVPYLVSKVLLTTTFPQIPFLSAVSLLLMILCIGLKILFFDRMDLKNVLLMVVALGIGGLNYIKTGDSIAFGLFLLAFGARGIDGKNILRVHFSIVFSICFLAFVAASLDVIKNWVYVDDETFEIKKSFGIIYSTDFAAHWCFLWLEFLYIKSERLQFYHYGLGILLATVLYVLSKGRIDCGSILIATFLFALYNYIQRSKHVSINTRKISEKLIRVFGTFSMAFFTVLSVIMSMLYQRTNGFLRVINKFMSSRLALGHKTFNQHDLTLFGEKFKMYGNGNGAGSAWPSGVKYNFIDISYLNILFTQGILVLLLVMVSYVILCYKRRYDAYLLIAIFVVGFNCSIAHHLMDIAYVPFLLLLVAGSELKGIKKRKKNVLQS